MNSTDNHINGTAAKSIERITEVSKKKKPLVAIHCITYNHEPYLRDALEGFVMQKTDFPFVAIVHEDASTDGTANILREYAVKYPDVILPIFETENQYSKRNGSLRRIMNKACEATGAKYIALCEGDDYWTDPYKLQQQIFILEKSKDIGLCYTKVRSYTTNGQLLNWTGKEITSFEDFILKNNGVPTCTAIIRTEIFRSYEKNIGNIQTKWSMGDFPLWLYISLNYKIKFLPVSTGVYRVLTESASHSKSELKWLKFQLNAREIKLFFINQYHPLPMCDLDRMDWKLYLVLLRRICETNNKELIEANKKLISNFRTYNSFKKTFLRLCTSNFLCIKFLKIVYHIKDRFFNLKA